MEQLSLRPDLKTTGGEVHDIMLNNQYAGTVALVYREGQRISGSIQLDQGMVSVSQKKEVVQYIQEYVQNMMYALEAKECEVLVMYSEYDHIIASDFNVGVIKEFTEQEAMDNSDLSEETSSDTDDWLMHTEPMHQPLQKPWKKLKQRKRKKSHHRAQDKNRRLYQPVRYELVIVGEKSNQVEYHIYGENEQWIAEALLNIHGSDVTGEITWNEEPSDEQIGEIVDLLVSDFDENEIDTFVLDMRCNEEILETIELTHHDLIDEDQDIELVHLDEDYTVVLKRDDGDTLSYEIYQHSYGGLPIGTATIDISRRQISGFIDFRKLSSSNDREYVAALLMQE
ncbi:MAG: hypothetical protein A2189_02260, partial [Paenibacillus sp. RIFOXYA1_FULL_44_5]